MATNAVDIVAEIQQIGGSTKGDVKQLKTRLKNINEDAPLTFDVIYKMDKEELRQALKQRDSDTHCDEKVALSEKEDLQLMLFQCLLKRRGEYTQTDEIEIKDEYKGKQKYSGKPKTDKQKIASIRNKKINSSSIEKTYMYIISETKLIKPFKFTIAASINSKVNLKIGQVNTTKNIQNAIKQLMEVKQMKKLQVIESKIFDGIYLNEIRNVLQNKFECLSISLALQNIQIKSKKPEDSLIIKNGSFTLIAGESYIGDLIICVPIRLFEGGQLIIDPDGCNSIISLGKWLSTEHYDKDKKEFKVIYWAAVRKHHKYKLMDVSKGYRMTFQYRIYSVNQVKEAKDKQIMSVIKEERVKKLIADYTLME